VIKQWLTSQLGYFADDMYQLADAKLAVNQVFDPRVIIVAKCHYQESWQSFSAINKKDAKKNSQTETAKCWRSYAYFSAVCE
jgi:hypothetical protein